MINTLQQYFQANDTDSDSDSDSDSSAFLPTRRQPTPGPASALSSDQSYFNAQGLKLREYQEKKYPSRFLDPNPDFRSRQKPFPILFDPKLEKAYSTFCRRAGIGYTVLSFSCLFSDVLFISLFLKNVIIYIGTRLPFATLPNLHCHYLHCCVLYSLTGDTRKIFVSKTVDESNSARVLVGCKPVINNYS